MPGLTEEVVAVVPSGSVDVLADPDVAPGTTPRRAGGRPRDLGREEAILAAALELVAETGYERTTVEAIAARARASKATIYRRWAGKAQLVAEAVRSHCVTVPVPSDTGDIRADLLEALTRTVADMACDTGVIGGLTTAMQSDAQLACLLREHMLEVRRDAGLAWVRRGIADGRFRPDVDVELLVELVTAVVSHRLLVTAEPVDAALVERLVDHVLLPLLLPTATVCVDVDAHR